MSDLADKFDLWFREAGSRVRFTKCAGWVGLNMGWVWLVQQVWSKNKITLFVSGPQLDSEKHKSGGVKMWASWARVPTMWGVVARVLTKCSRARFSGVRTKPISRLGLERTPIETNRYSRVRVPKMQTWRQSLMPAPGFQRRWCEMNWVQRLYMGGGLQFLVMRRPSIWIGTVWQLFFLKRTRESIRVVW